MSAATAPIDCDTKVVIFAAGVMFLLALSLGAWKWRQMASADDGLAHPYVDTAHRAALLYSFALILIAAFVELGDWSRTVNLIAAGVLIFFFFGAVAGYAYHGARRDTDNQFRDPIPGTGPYMVALTGGEIIAFAVLLAGFIARQF